MPYRHACLAQLDSEFQASRAMSCGQVEQLVCIRQGVSSASIMQSAFAVARAISHDMSTGYCNHAAGPAGNKGLALLHCVMFLTSNFVAKGVRDYRQVLSTPGNQLQGSL